MSSDALSNAYPNALPAGTRIRDYSIISVIGIGGFSIVYKAMDTALMREVAIKEYFPGGISLRDNDGTVRSQPRETDAFRKGIDSFLNEGKLLAQFDHPALVRVYRFWEERGTAYLAMRLYTGVTLRDAVNAGSWSANEETLPALLLPVCEALEVLHSANCYHRDVAPDNILLGENNWPVLLDFGAARKAIEGTQVFTAILKPGYAPIEQYGDGELKQGPWTDIYALAGVIYFTLSGGPPPTAISRMLRDSMPRPRDVFAGRLPERWLDAMAVSLAVKPEDRPQSLGQFISLMGWDEMSAPAVDLVTHEVRADLPLPASPESVILAPPVMPTIAEDIFSAQTRTVENERAVVVRPAELPPAPTRPEPEPEREPIAPPAPPPRVELAVDRANTSSAPQLAADSPGFNHVGKWLAIAAGLASATLFALWSISGTRTQPATTPIKAPSPAVIAPKSAPSVVAPAAAPIIGLPSNDASRAPNTSLPKDVTPASPIKDETRPEAMKPPVTVKKEGAKSTLVPTPARKIAPGTTAREPRDEDAPVEPRESRQPGRCAGLLDRWGLGAVLSDEEQSFLTEKCK